MGQHVGSNSTTVYCGRRVPSRLHWHSLCATLRILITDRTLFSDLRERNVSTRSQSSLPLFHGAPSSAIRFDIESTCNRRFNLARRRSLNSKPYFRSRLPSAGA
ncbi:hypothetical protein HGRIS_002761 [Hohenbuehelia grisea]|uniref:Uncharacterized protein n=1 Tax=Hohenbuehelia grisea TaxID=104357 RepID=A0ABR3JLL2_9AGAR